MPSGFRRQFVGSNSSSLTLDATDTTQYTPPINVGRGDVLALHVVWTATAGTLSASAVLQESCIPDADTTSDADWVDSGDVTFAGASGTDTKELFNIGNVGSGLIRVKFSRSAGSGSVICYWAIKKKSA